MNVDEMKAGKELDKLVAECVMGWRAVWVRGYHIGHFIGGHYETKDACAADCVNHCYEPVHLWANAEGSTFGKGEQNWSPSKNIAHAWEVAEKMVSDGHVFIVKGDGLRTGDFSPRWTVLCDNLPRTDSDSAPLAICLAALKAVEATLPVGSANPKQ